MKTYINPIISKRADPWVYRHTDGAYYFSATYPAFDRIVLRRADSIQALGDAPEVTVLSPDSLAQWGLYPQVWAPELHFLQNKWYLFFTASPQKTNVWTIRQWVACCSDTDPLSGKWELCGQVSPDQNDAFSVDGTVFECGGNWYYVWNQHQQVPYEPKTKASIYIAKADPSTDFVKLLTKRVLIAEPGFLRPETPPADGKILEWEHKKYWVNEGPAILKRNGRVFIAYSASDCDESYCLGLLAADENADLLDPASWTKSPVPVFATSETNGIYGPGHCSFTKDGDEDVICYHARNYKGLFRDDEHKEPVDEGLADPHRDFRAKTFTWKAEGTPDFGEPV